MINYAPTLNKTTLHHWNASDLHLVLDVSEKTIGLYEEFGESMTCGLEYAGGSGSERDENQVEFLRNLAQCINEAADVWQEKFTAIPLEKKA